MAFIRKVRTASGATAVQIAEYAAGRRQRIVRHVGSARTPAELGVLLERARGLLADPHQEMLALEVEASPPVAALTPPPAQPALVAGPWPGRPAERDGPGRVVATGSRLLFDALAGVSAGLGFSVVEDETFRDLVIARIVEPTSILDTGRVLTDLGRVPASEKTMRRTLTRATSGKYRDQIATVCFEHAITAGDVSLCLYDVTTLYFEAEHEDALRKAGYSKERRVDPQDDAEKFLGELRGRLAKFALELHPDKTRLIEFGPRAARDRKARGEGKPETFTFLGFRHIARMNRQGRFWVQRITDKKKMTAKLKSVKAELMKRRHLPVPEQGRW